MQKFRIPPNGRLMSHRAQTTIMTGVCLSVVLLAAWTACPPMSASADIRVSETDDYIRLHDGTVINGIVICAGMKAVIMITRDKEIVLDRGKVDQIVRGKKYTISGFQTEIVDGHESVVKRGYRPRPEQATERSTQDTVLQQDHPSSRRTGQHTLRNTPTEVQRLLQQMQQGDGRLRNIDGMQSLEELKNNPVAKRMAEEYGGMENLLRAFRQRRNAKK